MSQTIQFIWSLIEAASNIFLLTSRKFRFHQRSSISDERRSHGREGDVTEPDAGDLGGRTQHDLDGEGGSFKIVGVDSHLNAIRADHVAIDESSDNGTV